MSRGGAFRLFGGWVRSHFEPLPISGDLGSLSGVGEGPRSVGLRAPVAVGARPRAAGRPLPSSSQLSSAHGSGMDFEVHSYLRAGSVPTPGGGVQLVGSWCTGPAPCGASAWLRGYAPARGRRPGPLVSRPSAANPPRAFPFGLSRAPRSRGWNARIGRDLGGCGTAGRRGAAGRGESGAAVWLRRICARSGRDLLTLT